MDFKNINISQVLLAVALIALIGYFTSSTTPVPNLNNVTGEYLYTENDYVPKNYVSNEMAGLGFILVVFLYFSARVKGMAKDILTERQFKEIVTREIRKKQTVPLPDGSYEIEKWKFKVDPNILPVYITEKGIRKLSKYVAQATLTDTYDVEHYYLVTGNPYTGIIDGMVPTDTKLSYVDKCPECGRFPDTKIILPEELKIIKEFKVLTQ